MVKPWDRGLKRLMDECPQDMLDWLLVGARFVSPCSEQFESITIEADAIHEIVYHGQRVLFHLEFQRNTDANMVQRLLEYNILAWRRYQCPVCSFVIFLKKGSSMVSSPMLRLLPDGEEVLRFHYRVILLWDMPFSMLLEAGIAGLLPLVSLARDGAQRDVIEKVIGCLLLSGSHIRDELLSLTYLFASLALEEPTDQVWLRRRFVMLRDILRDTPAFQDILQEGREEERRKGLEAQRQLFLNFVQARYPDLVAQAKKRSDSVDDPDVLNDLILKIGLSQDIQQFRKYLQDV